MLLLMSLYNLQRSGNVSFLALRYIVRIITPLGKTIGLVVVFFCNNYGF